MERGAQNGGPASGWAVLPSAILEYVSNLLNPSDSSREGTLESPRGEEPKRPSTGRRGLGGGRRGPRPADAGSRRTKRRTRGGGIQVRDAVLANAQLLYRRGVLILQGGRARGGEGAVITLRKLLFLGRSMIAHSKRVCRWTQETR